MQINHSIERVGWEGRGGMESGGEGREREWRQRNICINLKHGWQLFDFLAYLRGGNTEIAMYFFAQESRADNWCTPWAEMIVLYEQAIRNCTICHNAQPAISMFILFLYGIDMVVKGGWKVNNNKCSITIPTKCMPFCINISTISIPLALITGNAFFSPSVIKTKSTLLIIIIGMLEGEIKSCLLTHFTLCSVHPIIWRIREFSLWFMRVS